MKFNLIMLLLFPVLLSGCAGKATYDDIKTLLSEGQTDMAIEKLGKPGSKDFEGNYLLGLSYMRKNKDEYKSACLKYFSQAYKINPDDYENSFWYGYMLYLSGDLDSAAKLLKKIEDSWPDYERNHQGTRMEPFLVQSFIAYDLQNYDIALINAEKSYESGAEQGECLMQIGKCHAKIEASPEILQAYYEKATRVSERKNELACSFGDGLLENRMYEKALDVFTELDCDGIPPELRNHAILQLSFISLIKGDFESADKLIKRSALVSRDNDMYRKYKSFYWYALDDIAKTNNAFVVYRFMKEAKDGASYTADDTYEAFENYFENDIYYQLLREKYSR